MRLSQPFLVLPAGSADHNYDSGMWSWDTYKQAVGMAPFAPMLAKEQLRLLVQGRDYNNKLHLPHIPDKVDRCGHGGGCAGKPPLLSWSVWEVYNHTGDHAFLAEMYHLRQTLRPARSRSSQTHAPLAILLNPPQLTIRL